MTALVIFRADGNNSIGMGHVVRCLVIAEMLRSTFECSFLITNPDAPVISTIQAYAHVSALPQHDTLDEEIDLLVPYLTPNTILVLDNYNFDSAYQQAVRSKVNKLVAIDDEARIHMHADLVINHSSPAMAAKYDKESYTKVLAGTNYLLARKAFRDAAKEKRLITKSDSLFVCMGGADPYNITTRVVKAAQACSFLNRIVVVTGSAYRHKHELEALVSDSRIQWKENIEAEEMIELIKSCELAVSTASSISLEICCVKSGLLTGIVAENQENIHQCLLENQCALSIGDFRETDEKNLIEHLYKLKDQSLIQQLMHHQGLLIDGLSGERILNEFKALCT
jgi:UDP-2,4-diacetamido-2,4,6-trideoxy-beta-L-altropyranose hydrolase